ncbi:hypothetical protein CMQ_687 [Grosmannia clavigera kw1407]|uniref:Methyltransferase type 11 n=1 Tax=Grosmannia clavigera (strain kw1407 / UAMH 11150) TaxID=655863 RepID=F0XEE4_GROCL|nr:uncharacterized protein CMQ_687 [Grosmannia clavigera kw1407]EFX03759.1 hypothetical protein CMQ_687 [Grosmannia clavigera kw1407]
MTLTLIRGANDEKQQEMLDLADFADQYPNCEVIGTDISPIQPIWLPSNLNVEIDDFTQPWTFDSDSLNFVHGRYLLGSIGDWVALAKEAYKCLAPGGYFESYEASPFIVSADGTVPETSAMGQWGKIYEDGGKKLGQSFTIVPDGVQKTAMEQAGFVDIEEWVFNGWSKVEIEAYAARFRRDLRNNEIHGTMMIRVIWGQKTE